MSNRAKKLNGYIVGNDYPKYWNDYINDINKFIKRLIKSNLLRTSTPRDSIKYLKVKELKDLLGKKSLIVYANGGSSSSNKYHKSANAHGMKDAIKMTENDAKKKGYVACGTCFR